SVVGGGPGHGERDGAQGGQGDSSTAIVLNRKRHHRRASRSAILYLRDIHHQSGKQTGSGRRHVRAQDRGVEIDFALRNVAGRTLAIVNLYAAWVIGTGGEIDIVVAGAARGATRIGQKCGRLRGAIGLRVAGHRYTTLGVPGSSGRRRDGGGLRVARFASPGIAWIRREDHGRVI